MPLQVSTQWKEIIPPGEADRFERYATGLRAMQKDQARGGQIGRGLHAKQHVGAWGELTVSAGLPEAL
jgi:hypothetical protein